MYVNQKLLCTNLMKLFDLRQQQQQEASKFFPACLLKRVFVSNALLSAK
jgi:hypothetical protein